jgi:uncharacterized membrane protein
MLSGVRRLGHSIPPTFVVFPLGMLSTSVIFDFAHLLGAGEVFSTIAYWMIMSGLTAGLAIAILGAVDWLLLPPRTRARKRAFIHLIAYTFVLVIYAFSAYSRNNDPHTPEIAATLFATFGAGIALFGATLGAELVGKSGRSEREVLPSARIVSVIGNTDRL